jgi:hypothetical protein
MENNFFIFIIPYETELRRRWGDGGRDVCLCACQLAKIRKKEYFHYIPNMGGEYLPPVCMSRDPHSPKLVVV